MEHQTQSTGYSDKISADLPKRSYMQTMWSIHEHQLYKVQGSRLINTCRTHAMTQWSAEEQCNQSVVGSRGFQVGQCQGVWCVSKHNHKTVGPISTTWVNTWPTQFGRPHVTTASQDLIHGYAIYGNGWPLQPPQHQPYQVSIECRTRLYRTTYARQAFMSDDLFMVFDTTICQQWCRWSDLNWVGDQIYAPSARGKMSCK